MSISDRVALHKEPESLSVEQQDQVFKNLGWKVHVISQSDINATTSPDAAEKTKRLEATALLVKETSLIYVRGNGDSSNHYFFKINCIKLSISNGFIPIALRPPEFRLSFFILFVGFEMVELTLVQMKIFPLKKKVK